MKFNSKKYHLRQKSYSKKFDKAYWKQLGKELKESYRKNDLRESNG